MLRALLFPVVSGINNPEKVTFFLHLCQIFYK